MMDVILEVIIDSSVRIIMLLMFDKNQLTVKTLPHLLFCFMGFAIFEILQRIMGTPSCGIVLIFDEKD